VLLRLPGRERDVARRDEQAGEGRRDVRVRAELPGRVDRADLVTVARVRQHVRVAVRGSRRLRDLREVRAARALAAFDPVAGDARGVVRRAPAQVDLGRRGDRRGEVGRRRGDGQAGVHVGLDLPGRQRAVVDAHLVDLPGEVLAVEAVAADL